VPFARALAASAASSAALCASVRNGVAELMAESTGVRGRGVEISGAARGERAMRLARQS